MSINNVQKDEVYQNYLNNAELSESTAVRYTQFLNKFVKEAGKSFSDIVNEALSEQKENDFNIKESSIIKYLNKYLESLLCSNKKMKPKSINKSMGVVRDIFKTCGVFLPYWCPLGELELSYDEISFILNSSNIYHKQLFSFVISSKIPISKCLDFTIADFINSIPNLKKKDIPSLIQNFPKNIVGIWEYYDDEGFKIAFNSEESNEYIIEVLKKRYELDSSLSPSDPLFVSSNKKPWTNESIKKVFSRKNKQLTEFRNNYVIEKAQSGNIPYELIEGELSYLKSKMRSKLSKFSIYGLKNYYSHSIDNHCNNTTLYNILNHNVVLDKSDSKYWELKKELLNCYKESLNDLSITSRNFENNNIDEDINEFFDSNLADNEENIYFKKRLKLYCLDILDKDGYHKEFLNYFVEYTDYLIYNEESVFNEFFVDYFEELENLIDDDISSIIYFNNYLSKMEEALDNLGDNDLILDDGFEKLINTVRLIDKPEKNMDFAYKFIVNYQTTLELISEFNLNQLYNYKVDIKSYIAHNTHKYGLLDKKGIMKIFANIYEEYPSLLDNASLLFSFELKKYNF